jgi:arginine decarboxylase
MGGETMATQNIQDALQKYGIDGWSSGYFGVSSRGTVQVHPFGNEEVAVDLTKILEHAYERPSRLP